MSTRYDLLVIDLDGTLLGPDGSVPPVNVAAMQAAREHGLEVMIATGRSLAESRRPLEAIEHEGAVVAAGGALRCCGATGKTLARHAMELDLVADVTHALLQHGHKVLLLKDPDDAGYDYLAVGPGTLDPASAWWFETMQVRVRFVHDVADDPHPFDTVRVAIVATESELTPIARSLHREIGDRGFLQHWGAVTEEHGSTTQMLEVFSPNVNKWTMVAAYFAEQGIDPARVAAVGDGLNDVELVREAGLGIAMGNADDRVREVADRVTADSGEGGVAQAIDHLLTGEW